jgi:hypothetical protein
LQLHTVSLLVQAESNQAWLLLLLLFAGCGEATHGSHQRCLMAQRRHQVSGLALTLLLSAAARAQRCCQSASALGIVAGTIWS